uniref:Secreted protein n=1 Tax=Trypanosoma congolense (strain IL3000) TaxID=1068625 RepID=G0V0G6_TRYCI|nr:hypothetical protein, unlikely [Trypanosoma congolense IL3000]
MPPYFNAFFFLYCNWSLLLPRGPPCCLSLSASAPPLTQLRVTCVSNTTSKGRQKRCCSGKYIYIFSINTRLTRIYIHKNEKKRFKMSGCVKGLNMALMTA